MYWYILQQTSTLSLYQNCDQCLVLVGSVIVLGNFPHVVNRGNTALVGLIHLPSFSAFVRLKACGIIAARIFHSVHPPFIPAPSSFDLHRTLSR